MNKEPKVLRRYLFWP